MQSTCLNDRIVLDLNERHKQTGTQIEKLKHNLVRKDSPITVVPHRGPNSNSLLYSCDPGRKLLQQLNLEEKKESGKRGLHVVIKQPQLLPKCAKLKS